MIALAAEEPRVSAFQGIRQSGFRYINTQREIVWSHSRPKSPTTAKCLLAQMQNGTDPHFIYNVAQFSRMRIVHTTRHTYIRTSSCFPSK